MLCFRKWIRLKAKPWFHIIISFAASPFLLSTNWFLSLLWFQHYLLWGTMTTWQSWIWTWTMPPLPKFTPRSWNQPRGKKPEWDPLWLFILEWPFSPSDSPSCSQGFFRTWKRWAFWGFFSNEKQSLFCSFSISIQLLPSTAAKPGGNERLLELYGIVVSMNPLGQMIFTPISGIVSNKLGSIRLVCLVTSGLYIFGNLLYAILSVFPEDSRLALLIVARLATGIASGNF